MRRHSKQITRQVYKLFQDLWNRFPYFEGWGVDATSLGVKTDTRHTGLAAINRSGEHFVGVNVCNLAHARFR